MCFCSECKYFPYNDWHNIYRCFIDSFHLCYINVSELIILVQNHILIVTNYIKQNDLVCARPLRTLYRRHANQALFAGMSAKLEIFLCIKPISNYVLLIKRSGWVRSHLRVNFLFCLIHLIQNCKFLTFREVEI